MTKFRVLIADDEPLGRQGLLSLLQTDPELEVVAACADGAAARESLLSTRPDLAFLDVQMPVASGLSLLAELPSERRPAAVFVTAHDSYAVKAFDICAVDYLVKPYRESRFREAVAKAKQASLRRRPPPPPATGEPSPARTAFRVARGHLLLDPADIVWIEAAGDGVKIAEGREVHAVREPLRLVEERLGAASLLRVHRSFLVNPRRIRRISPLLYGEHELLMSDGVRIRVGRAFRDQLKKLLPGASKR